MKNMILLLCLLSLPAFGKDMKLISAPRGLASKEIPIYAPIAEHFSKFVGEGNTVTYKPARVNSNNDMGNAWTDYRKLVMELNQEDKASFTFDGPQFNHYRAAFKNGQFIARLDTPLKFVVITHVSNTVDINRLDGRSACLQQEPNLATLKYLTLFPLGKHPMRITVEGFEKAYEGVENRKCRLTVVTEGLFKKLNKDGLTKIVYTFPPLPNQSFMASADVPKEVVARLRDSIIAGECTACNKLLEIYSAKAFVAVNEPDYDGMSNVLLNDIIMSRDLKFAMRSVR